MSTTPYRAECTAVDQARPGDPVGMARTGPVARGLAVALLLVVGAVTVTVVTVTAPSAPATAGPSSTWAQVSAGANHTCAVSDTGGAFCWGRDGNGQLGNGAALTGDQVAPSPVAAPAGVSWASISAGDLHTCAVSDTGGAFCWGSDSNGQLGNGPGLSFIEDQVAPSPVQGPGGVSWAFINAGAFHTCGVVVAGDAFCWGDDGDGQLGNGAVMTGTRPSPSPVDAPVVTSWAAISAEGFHTCAATVAGEAFCWGGDGDGQLGNGAAIAGVQVSPSLVDTPAGVSWRSIDAGGNHTCALGNTGDGFCWGSDGFGQLGNGDAITGDQRSPSQVDAQAVVWAAISAGGSHTCALSDGGDSFCWGNDGSGQLGDGAVITGDQPSPSPVTRPTVIEPPTTTTSPPTTSPPNTADPSTTTTEASPTATGPPTAVEPSSTTTTDAPATTSPSGARPPSSTRPPGSTSAESVPASGITPTDGGRAAGIPNGAASSGTDLPGATDRAIDSDGDRTGSKSIADSAISGSAEPAGTVAEPLPRESLARTGTDMAVTIVIAFALIVTGSYLLARHGRTRTT